MTRSPHVSLYLPGGGTTGAMYQVGVLAALEDTVEGLDANAFDLYVGTSSGATVASALAGGQAVQRIYRSCLDPADVYFPLERRHIAKVDLGEWRRTFVTALQAFRHGTANLVSRGPAPSPAQLWEELDRLYDSLPAGLFSLDNYERFLEEFFLRRGIPNYFHALDRELVILAHDLDSGERVLFGGDGFSHLPIARAAAASMALPPFFSPVRIGERHYIDAGAAQVSALDVATDRGTDVLVVINPMVPVLAEDVPTGHGRRPSLRDKGYLWVANQAIRIGVHALMQQSVAAVRASGREVILIEPEPGDGIRFMYNPASFSARREILEYAYRTTKDRVRGWLSGREAAVQRAGWKPKWTAS